MDDVWFEQQFGKRPTKKDLSELYYDRMVLQKQLARIENLIQNTERWDAQYQAIVYYKQRMLTEKHL